MEGLLEVSVEFPSGKRILLASRFVVRIKAESSCVFSFHVDRVFFGRDERKHKW